MDEILFTNIDVTSAQFAYALINIGRTPASQNRLRTELQTLGTDHGTVTSFVRKDDTLLHKTYFEILRNNSPICMLNDSNQEKFNDYVCYILSQTLTRSHAVS